MLKLKPVFFIFAVCLIGTLSLTRSAHAFLFEVEVLDQKQIAKLSDTELSDRFIDAAVEMEAVKTFYTNSAFTPKEYRKYKDLLKYRVLLIQEIHKRKLEIPSMEP